VTKIEELDRLDRAIKDCDIKLKSILSNIEQIDKEIAVLAPRKLELEKNIEFHKKSTTIPIAQEYRKTKAELSKVTARLIFIRADYGKAVEASKQVEEIIEKFKRDHLELLKTSENNLLTPNFGRKNGKK
jgi:chromosome segregation ATPase